MSAKVSQKRLPSRLASLAERLKPGQLITDPVELLTYEVDAALDRGRPEAVLLVHSPEDVVQAVQWAAQHRVPVIARGAGTGLSGGAVAHDGGLILEFSHLNHILELDLDGRSAVVEPGLVNQKLDETVKKEGLYYPPDPASGRSATIGGNVAENAGGPHCFKYGVTTNYVSGLELVLADGKVIHLGGRAVDYPEYDLLGVVTGSEGTLGIITRVCVRLLCNPPAVLTMMAAFDTLEDAGRAVSAVIAAGLVPATLEMMDSSMMGSIEAYVPAGLPVEAGAALIIEVDGFPDSLPGQMDEIAALLQSHHAWGLHTAKSTEERDSIWYGRKSAAGAMARLSPAYYLLDGTVPRSKLADTLRAISAVCAELALRVAYVFHAGDGNLHPFVLIDDVHNPEVMERVYKAGRQIMEICVQQGGSITGEHGVGIEKRQFMPLMYSIDELQVMRTVKQVFDPEDLLNPGKIFPESAEGPAQINTSILEPRGEIPGGVAGEQVEPVTAEEASEVICQWIAEGRSIRLRGGGTKSAWLSPAERLLKTTRLRGIQAFSPEDLYVTVGAGTSLLELQAELAEDHMWLPLVSPWPEATIGGILSTNFNAPLRMRYGSLRDLLLAVTIVLPDGRLVRLGRPVVKNVAGYDMPKLFVGAHGTLGLIADATFKLAPLPRERISLVAPASDLNHGLEWGRLLLRSCLNTSALLLMRTPDGHVSPPYTLVRTIEGHPEDVATEMTQARRMLENHGATIVFSVGTYSASLDWGDWLRKGSKAVRPGDCPTCLQRAGVAPKDLPELIKSLADVFDAYRDKLSYYADLASGLLYLKGVDDLSLLQAAAVRLGGYAIMLSGGREENSPWGYQSEAQGLMQQLKHRWDPHGQFNPGAFLVN